MLDFQDSPTLPRFAFGPYDEVIMNGISYSVDDSDDFGFMFIRTDGSKLSESFTHQELSRRVRLGILEHRRDAFLPDAAKRRLKNPSQEISTLPVKQQQKAKYHESLVRAFLEMETEGKVKRTEASVTAALPEIKFRAGRFLSIPSEGDVGEAGGNRMTVPTKISAGRLLKRVAAFSRDGMSALYGRSANGSRTRRIGPDELALLSKTVRNFLTMEKPTIAHMVEDVRDAFIAENRRRRSQEGEKQKSPLVMPSRETIRLAVRKIDPFEMDIARFGLDEARKRNAPVGKGLELTRPLERVEMDEWKIDLIDLLAENGLWSILTDEEKASLGYKEGKKPRWFLTAAICTTTRCFLGIKLSRAPSARSAIQTIDMIVRDKGVLADALGAQSAWNMSGTPELIVTDCGSAFIDFDTRAGATDLGIHIDAGPAGMPEFRARIERVFGTMSTKLIGRFSGRTFSNTIQKGDYDAEARAALSSDDLSEALVRWIVDVYHRTPHPGLNGETPANCWKRLVEKYGVAPMPGVKMRRKALGTRLKCTVTKTGITVLGIRYHSEVLARWFMHSPSREVRVRWYSEDIGAIEVELDGDWIEVPSVFNRYQGERAQTWIMAVHEIRASVAAQKKVDEDVIFDAMTRIREINSDAMARNGLMVEDYSAERVASLENGMLIGFETDETPRDAEHLSTDNMGLELHISQSRKTGDVSARSTPDDPIPAPEADDEPWTLDEK